MDNFPKNGIIVNSLNLECMIYTTQILHIPIPNSIEKVKQAKFQNDQYQIPLTSHPDESGGVAGFVPK